jgi:hypothetical protein
VQARKDAEALKPRLDDANKEIYKLERALEIKVSQNALAFGRTLSLQVPL